MVGLSEAGNAAIEQAVTASVERGNVVPMSETGARNTHEAFGKQAVAVLEMHSTQVEGAISTVEDRLSGLRLAIREDVLDLKSQIEGHVGMLEAFTHCARIIGESLESATADRKRRRG